MADETDDDEISLPEDDQEGGNAGQVHDEGGVEASGSEDTGGQAEEGLEAPDREEVRQPSRGERHFGKLRSEVRLANERAERLERELAEIRRQREQPQPQRPREETEQEFVARLALMTPEERIEARLSRSERIHQHQLMMMQMRTADLADRSRFEGMSAANPLFKRVAAEVEQTLAFERQRGRDFDRETIAYFLLGKRVAESKGKVKEAQARGAANIARQTTRPDAGRSDVRPQRRETDPREALEKRLLGVQI